MMVPTFLELSNSLVDPWDVYTLNGIEVDVISWVKSVVMFKVKTEMIDSIAYSYIRVSHAGASQSSGCELMHQL